ncbi:MAG: TIGR00725 family protein [Candidatus Hydrothermarchaeales archaeon]
MLQIAVIGSSDAAKEIYDMAEEVGREIGRAGCVVVCGGLGGVMEASAKGAKEEGGITVGILPGVDSSDANNYIDIKVVTAASHARNAIIARTADALIAVGGGFGTLSEIALALNIGKPVVVLKGVEGIPHLLEIKELFSAENPKEAVKLAIEKGKSLLGE